jgi:hypothetical protein
MLKGSCRSCSDKLFQGCCIAVLRVACVHKVCIVRCKMRSERKYKNHHHEHYEWISSADFKFGAVCRASCTYFTFRDAIG